MVSGFLMTHLVMVETFSAELNLAQLAGIELYGNIYRNLAAVTSYGRDARTIINTVVDELSSSLAEGSS